MKKIYIITWDERPPKTDPYTEIYPCDSEETAKEYLKELKEEAIQKLKGWDDEVEIEHDTDTCFEGQVYCWEYYVTLSIKEKRIITSKDIKK